VVVPEVRKVVPVPEGVNVTVETGGNVKVSGPNATIERTFAHPQINIDVADGEVVLQSKFPRKKTRALTGTWAAHIRNMTEGAAKDFEYKLKIVYSHFPIKAKVEGQKLAIENFIGEKTARSATIREGVKVKVSGEDVTVTGANIEDVSQTAANIEQACTIRGYDTRVFQDGIYITSKGE
jgi:large subunit ribosomal protein L6